MLALILPEINKAEYGQKSKSRFPRKHPYPLFRPLKHQLMGFERQYFGFPPQLGQKINQRKIKKFRDASATIFLKIGSFHMD